MVISATHVNVINTTKAQIAKQVRYHYVHFIRVDYSDMPCHSVKADIMMLLDSSASVGSTYFRKQLQFVQSVVNSFDIGQSSVNMGVVTFSSAPHPQFKLNDYQTKHSLIDAINRIHHQSGGTNTDSAIDYLLKHSFTARNGDRSDAPNIAVIITDGQSSSRQSTIREANLLHNRGITTVAIGIGGGINLKELIGIASNQSLVFTVANFDALHTIQGLVDHSICQASAGGVPTIWPGMIG
ncbi:hypothetical protein KUTeg_008787 [Tegillarca granosa]|uniref:VWFA domain-containing protein n=1 Tax=Tegillarca granosa TaxID=220873 RepID=A0ABQ9FA82_TEGGR|nr:hypothetical protein KUTeg_008787 [Tegillarca granosa]